MSMKTSFCCASLHTGSLIVGWVCLIYIILFMIGTIGGIVLNRTNKNDEDEWAAKGPTYEFNGRRKLTDRAIYTVAFLVIGFHIGITVSLLYGTYKKRPGFLMPFLVFSVLKVVITTCGALSEFTTNEVYWIVVLAYILDTFGFIYFIAVVASYYRELRLDNNQPPK